LLIIETNDRNANSILKKSLFKESKNEKEVVGSKMEHTTSFNF
jgi:hypothetical protein